MKKIPVGYIFPSAAFSVSTKKIKGYQFLDKKPEVGDLMYGKVVRIGQHSQLENKSGRLHQINDGASSLFVYGNRYAPDYYEGLVPESSQTTADLLARSGVIGEVSSKNSIIKDPTKVRVLGNVCDSEGNPLNTKDFCLVNPNLTQKKSNRSKMILVVGTSMNSGKSTSAVACCWGLKAMGYDIRASKITGTASLKDILHMQDVGASHVNDFTHFGFPSTYLATMDELISIFDRLDLKYANNANNFWVVEIADGILQRETKMLLSSPSVKDRIHKLVFAANDSSSAIGGIEILKQQFDLVPDVVSGRVSSSPLSCAELAEFTDIPVLNNIKWDLKQISELFLN